MMGNEDNWSAAAWSNNLCTVYHVSFAFFVEITFKFQIGITCKFQNYMSKRKGIKLNEKKMVQKRKSPKMVL